MFGVKTSAGTLYGADLCNKHVKAKLGQFKFFSDFLV